MLAVTHLLATHGPLRGPLNVTLVRATHRFLGSVEAQTSSGELDQLAERLRAGGINARYLLEFEAPESGILDAAQQTRADLILLMPHGRQGLDALMHPSVTAKLLASGTAPLLIWPERLPDMWAQECLQLPGAVVVLPLDGSLQAERALPYALELANASGRSLVLLRVIPDLIPPMAALDGATFVTPDLLRLEHEEARAYLTSILERYANDLGAPIQSMLMTGAPERRILDLADAHLGSVIVMSTHGRSTLARTALGSVTSTIVQDASAPVLVIPPHAPAPLARTAPLKRPTVVGG